MPNLCWICRPRNFRSYSQKACSTVGRMPANLYPEPGPIALTKQSRNRTAYRGKRPANLLELAFRVPGQCTAGKTGSPSSRKRRNTSLGGNSGKALSGRYRRYRDTHSNRPLSGHPRRYQDTHSNRPNFSAKSQNIGRFYCGCPNRGPVVGVPTGESGALQARRQTGCAPRYRGWKPLLHRHALCALRQPLAGGLAGEVLEAPRRTSEQLGAGRNVGGCGVESLLLEERVHQP